MTVPEPEQLKSNPSAGQISLRAVEFADLPVFFEHQLDANAARMAAFASRDWAAFMAHWQKIMADDQVVIKTILYDGQVAGNVVSFIMQGQREVGYWIGKEFWGRGIATLALKKFLENETHRPLYAEVAAPNLASQRVLEKCGFERIAIEKATAAADAEPVDMVVLRLNA